MDKSKVEQGVRMTMEGLGLDLELERLRDTPRRVAAMFADDFFARIDGGPR